MAIVMNMSGHAVSLTVGMLGARETRNADTSLPLEQSLISDGILTIVDPTVTPPAPITPPGGWKESVESVGVLPATGNNDGDVRIVRDLATPYMWDGAGSEWSPLITQGGGGGGGNEGRVLRWDDAAGAYTHPEWWTDTSEQRQFIGPENPQTIDGIVTADYDTWTPTDEPA